MKVLLKFHDDYVKQAEVDHNPSEFIVWYKMLFQLESYVNGDPVYQFIGVVTVTTGAVTNAS